jgi:pyruvate,water dikinase
MRQHIDFARESISARQVKAIWQLAQVLRAQPDVWRQVEVGTEEAFFEFKRLLSLGPEVAVHYYTYMNTFGGRFANELKLETPDLANDFGPFCQALRLYASVPEPVGPVRAEKSTVDRLSWLNRWLLRQFEFYAQRREELRLLRSNTFGALRRALVHMGRRLHQDYKAIDAPEDIFYLRKEHLEPVLNLARQQPARSDQDAHWRERCLPLLTQLRILVKAAKESYAAFQSVPPPPAYFVSLNGDPIPSYDEKTETSGDENEAVGGVFRGTGCCVGKVTGRVRVFEEHAMPSEVDFDVLVAPRTDPGWILLIRLTKAMVVEEGNLLSHAASVAREFRIPTVIGVRNACTRLRTGQVVEVDGGSGTVMSSEAS